jgi:hypothetical protein
VNSKLGVETPFSTSFPQISVPYGYVDPPTEVLADTGSATGTRLPDDGVQVWRIRHYGVNTHPLHFPQLDVQVVNRVRWDGGVVPPDDNEMGWKDTVRVNPVEDIVVALRPKLQTLPWELPNSVRLLDVTQPSGSTLGFSGTDPNYNPVQVTNRLVNLGYEYAWDCQLVSHRDNDSLRPLVLASGPNPPRSVLAAWDAKTGAVTLSWMDDSVNETGFQVERAISPAGPWKAFPILRGAAEARGDTLRFSDTSVVKGTTYFYRVVAINEIGYTENGTGPVGAFPFVIAESAPVITSVSVK